MKNTFGVIGGDRRQAELARLLMADDHTVYTYGLEQWGSPGTVELERALAAETVILPLPLCNEAGELNCAGHPISVAELFRKLRPGQRILAGQIKPRQRQEAEACGLNLEDYFLREEMTVANAAVTAEAAVQVALERMETSVLGMDCLVLGFGRIGKLLCHRLDGLGARIAAAARKPEDLAWIRAYGWKALRTDSLDRSLSDFGLVFNTIPSLVLGEALLRQLPGDCLCIDLASQPGIDFAAAEKVGVSAVWARALPGRMKPLAAAKILKDTIYNI